MSAVFALRSTADHNPPPHQPTSTTLELSPEHQTSAFYVNVTVQLASLIDFVTPRTQKPAIEFQKLRSSEQLVEAAWRHITLGACRQMAVILYCNGGPGLYESKSRRRLITALAAINTQLF